VRGEAAPKPLPAQDRDVSINPPFDDAPLVTQAPPEQPAFVEAYTAVGKPRIAVYINRTFQGQPNVPPTTPPETGRAQAGPGAVEIAPPARIDYDAMENILTDWFSGGGKVTLVSAKLSEAQIGQVQNGAFDGLKELSDKQQVDVLIFVRASETKQSPRGLEVRLVGEAINTVGGESLGRAVVDAPPILEKRVLNEYTRFVARKLMKDMTQSWNNPPMRRAAQEQPQQPLPRVEPSTRPAQ
jgi:hypothetical protein